jgi:Fic family protein
LWRHIYSFNYLIINKIHINPAFTLVHHSASIEGATLTEIETRLLLEENIVPKGKPLIHSHMVRDHYDALQFVLESATAKKTITTEFIQQINAHVLKNTGGIYNTVFGQIDASKGMFRKGNVSAGGRYFLNYDKVAPYTMKLAKHLDERLPNVQGQEEQLKLSFAAHFDLVSIHPFYDGNGRTSRLLMNYIQAYHGLSLAVVFVENKQDYYRALQEATKQEDRQIFDAFMFDQYKKTTISSFS